MKAFSIGGCCHCDPPLLECFGCSGQSSPLGSVGDVIANIGESLSWDKPLDHSCSYGVTSGSPGIFQYTGNTYTQFHSVGISAFGGSVTLQKNPDGLCIWRKRRVKLLQVIGHDVKTVISGGTIIGRYLAELEESVTYPYSDPVDASDQWSDIVYPTADSRCGTSYTTPSSANVWECRNESIQNLLQLSIARLKLTTYLGVDVLAYDETGDLYWELRLVTPQAFSGYTELTRAFDSDIRGGVRSYENYTFGGSGISEVIPASTYDLDICPPYRRIEADSYYTHANSDPDLFSGYDPTVLRWTKQIDCETDFSGEPISLTLDIPRAFLTSGVTPTTNYAINAEKFNLTGYSDTATIDIQYA